MSWSNRILSGVDAGVGPGVGRGVGSGVGEGVAEEVLVVGLGVGAGVSAVGPGVGDGLPEIKSASQLAAPFGIFRKISYQYLTVSKIAIQSKFDHIAQLADPQECCSYKSGHAFHSTSSFISYQNRNISAS
jgi:hypothetical protein